MKNNIEPQMTTCGDEGLSRRATAIAVLRRHFDPVLTGTLQAEDRTRGTGG